MNTKTALFAIACLVAILMDVKGQSVGIGTETPNPNAILELVAPNHDQGLLVPRMSTSDRTATNFTSNLSASDNGLMVYDEDLNQFFFWINTEWVQLAANNSGLPEQSSESGKFLSTDGANATWSEIDFNVIVNVPDELSDGDDVNDADNDPSNEIQDLSLTGNTLSITGGTTEVDLSPFSGTNTDNQTLTLTGTNLAISGGNTLDISSIDTDTDTQLSDADITALGYIKNANDPDADPTNEIQDLALTGNTLSLTNSVTTVDLSPFSGTNTDNQTVSLSGTNLSITGGNTIDLSSIDTDTDTNLTEAEVDAFVSDNGYLTSEADGSTTNEIQDLTLSGSSLSLTGSAEVIDLSPFSGTNTDNQTVSLSGTNLSITGGNTIDLSSINTDTDTNLTEDEVDAFVADNGYLTSENQDLSFDGTNLSITGGSSFDISSIDTDTDTQLTEAEVDAFVADNGYLTTEVDGSTTNEIQNLTFNSGIIALSNDPGNTTIDLSGFDTDASDDFSGDYNDLSNPPTIPNVPKTLSSFINDAGFITSPNDGDTNTSNELQDLSLSGNTLSLTSSSATVDLSPFEDTNLTEAEVDAFVSDNGYLTEEVDGSASNEIQTVSKSGNTVTLSRSGGSFSVADNDNSASNEIQSISRSGDNIVLNRSGGSASVRDYEPSAFKASVKGGTQIGSSLAIIPFSEESYDINGDYDGSSGFFIVPEDGLYTFSGLMVFQEIPSSILQIILLDKDSNVYFQKIYAANSINHSISFSVDLDLRADTQIGVFTSQTGEGNTINAIGSPSDANFYFSGKRFN